MKHLVAAIAVLVMVCAPMAAVTATGDDVQPSPTSARYIECPVIIQWLCDRL